MSFITHPAFLDDAYLTACEGKVITVNKLGGIILDKTNFYATSGGQPGDTGHLEREDGSTLKIATTINGETKKEIILVPEEGEPLPQVDEVLVGHIDWERRYQLMKMHTACHLLSVCLPLPDYGGVCKHR